MKDTNPSKWQNIALGLIVGGVILLALGGFLSPILNIAMNPVLSIQEWISTRYSALYQVFTRDQDAAALRQRNAVLEQQVAEYQKELVQLREQLAEAQSLYALLDFAKQNPQNEVVAGLVIGRDPSPYPQYIFINRGSDDGLRHGMPVVSDKGLVGSVDAVTANAARIQLITDAGSVVNVRLQTSRADAQLSGSVTGDLTLDMVSQEISLTSGEILLTSGVGGSYPQNLLVGVVTNVRKSSSDLFQSAAVQSAVDFAGLQSVLVITNFRTVDIAPLEP